MHEAGLFVCLALAEQAIEACEPIGMYGAGVPAEMMDGMFALAIHAELIPRAGRGLTAPRPFIADITPETCSLCLL